MIEVDSVRKSYGGFKVLSNVCLEVEKGETVGIVGPSGSGKTTLMRIIAGLEKPDMGSVVIDGTLATSGEYILEPVKRNMSVIFQVPALWPHMTVRGNIEYVHSGLGRNFEELMSRTGLSQLLDKYPNELSGGEARRVSVVRGLVADKKYLLMDEPLINLNPELKTKIHEVIKEWTAKREMGVLYITHDESELDYADIIYTLESGVLESK